MAEVTTSSFSAAPGVDAVAVTTGSDIDIVATYGKFARQIRAKEAMTSLTIDTYERSSTDIGPMLAGETVTVLCGKIHGTGTEASKVVLLIF